MVVLTSALADPELETRPASFHAALPPLPPTSPIPLKNLTTESGNQDHWISALDGLGDSTIDVCKSFGEPRYAVMQRLVKAGVEHPRWEGAPLQTFIDAPDIFIDPLRSERLHVFVEPAPGVHAKRYKFKDISAKDALELAEGLRAFPNKEQYVVTLVESPKLVYHGNVTVYDQKDCAPSPTMRLPQVTGEFVSGNSLPVSRGVAPEFRVWQDPYLETYKFDFAAEAVRRELYESLKVIPRLQGGIRPRLLPGYYEIGIAAGKPGEPNRAYLYDMKSWESL